MPIEFNCPQCSHRLRTPDGTEGRAAVCPNCSQQVTIPSQSTEATPPPPNAPGSGDSPSGQGPSPSAADSAMDSDDTGSPFGESPSTGTFNPYAAPSTQTDVPQEGTVAELTPTQTSASEILTLAWNTFRDNLMHFFLLGLVLMAIYIGGYIIGMVFGVMAAILGPGSTALMITFQVLNFTWAQIYGSFLSAVGIRYSLSVTAGNSEPMQGAFNVLPYMVRLVLTQLVVTLLIAAAALVCFAPLLALIPLENENLMIGGGIFLGVIAAVVLVYLGCRLGLAATFIIDRNQGIVEAIASSAAYTKGNVLAIFLSGLVIGVVMIVIVIITCFLGMVIAMPFQALTIVLIYRLVTGQGTGGQNPFAQE